jgi:Leucine Rich Repeat
MFSNFCYLLPNNQYNRLTGGIPSGVFNLGALTHLNLAWNPLSIGTISTEIQKLTSLKILSLDSCGITGTIPVELFSLTRLSKFLSWLHSSHREMWIEFYLTNQLYGLYKIYIRLVENRLQRNLWDPADRTRVFDQFGYSQS